jgi:hypothetical protein
MAGHHRDGKAEQNAPEKEFLDCGNHRRRAADPQESESVEVRFERKNTSEDVGQRHQNNWNQGQKKAERKVAFPLSVWLKSEIREAAHTQTAEGWVEKDDGRNLNTPAEVAMERKALNNRENTNPGEP